jgi:hypothetical protein
MNELTLRRLQGGRLSISEEHIDPHCKRLQFSLEMRMRFVKSFAGLQSTAAQAFEPERESV